MLHSFGHREDVERGAHADQATWSGVEAMRNDLAYRLALVHADEVVAVDRQSFRLDAAHLRGSGSDGVAVGDSVALAGQRPVAEEAELVRQLLDHGVDGLLISVCDRIASRHTVRTAANQVPTVEVDRLAVNSQHFVGVDQRQAIAQVVEHLSEAGRRRLVYVGSSPNISSAAERIEAFRELAQVHDPSSQIEVGDFSVEWGREATRRFLARRPLPDAIVCATT